MRRICAMLTKIRIRNRMIEMAKGYSPAPGKMSIIAWALKRMTLSSSIGWNAPLARALRGARVGDVKTVTLPTGPKEWEVVGIAYPIGE